MSQPGEAPDSRELRSVPFRRYDPWTKTALNDVGMDAVRRDGQAIFWLAGWDRPTINVGYGQDVQEEVDIEQARADDVAIVRRQGGGGTTYLTPDGELTWGLFLPRSAVPTEFDAVYSTYCGRVVDALAELGITASHEPINDVVTGSGKISGATVREDGDAVYIGGTLLYDVVPERMFQYLTPGADKLEDKPIEQFQDRVTSVTQESDASFQDCIDALTAAFCDGHTVETRDWTMSEQAEAERLAAVYRSDSWLYDRERDA